MPSLALIAVSLIPMIVGKSSLLYCAAAFMLGSIFSYYSFQLLVASIIYLPVAFVFMVLGKN